MMIPAMVLALALFSGPPGQAAEKLAANDTQAHVSSTFHFEIAAPMARLAPLFGPEGERSWTGEHWNPVFLYPRPALDVQGAVFTVQYGPHKSVWVNTLFNLPGGRMQYVSFIDGVMATTGDVTLTATGPGRTQVRVTYARTALDATHNTEVLAMGARDRDSGPEWQAALEKALTAERN